MADTFSDFVFGTGEYAQRGGSSNVWGLPGYQGTDQFITTDTLSKLRSGELIQDPSNPANIYNPANMMGLESPVAGSAFESTASGESATMPYGANPFADFVETEPEIPYQGALSRANLTPNQLRTFRGQRQNIFNQFLSQLDEQMRAGQMPSARFSDFIGDFNFQREYQRFAPSDRPGSGIGRFAPPTRITR